MSEVKKEYGEVLCFLDKKNAKIGKRYVFSDNLREIMKDPDTLEEQTLADIAPDNDIDEDAPFLADRYNSYQFVREVKITSHRPFESAEEFIKYAKNHVNIYGNFDVYKTSSNEVFNVYLSFDKVYLVRESIPFELSFEEFFYNYVWLNDGTPCGVKID